MIEEKQIFKKDKLQVSVFEKEQEVGAAGALFVARELNAAIAEKDSAVLIIATGNSQLLFLDHLKQQLIDWGKVTVFHLDEYMDLPETHPASFRKYVKERFINEVHPKHAYCMAGDAPDIDVEILRYEHLLRQNPVDVACIGIGENGHIAFNDPPVADFKDTKWVKVVELDEACRRQQWKEGWFPTLEDVPTKALTLTVPAIMASKTISCVVPDERKSQAVYDTLNTAISTECPATILRKHPHAKLYLDVLAASKLPIG